MPPSAVLGSLKTGTREAQEAQGVERLGARSRGRGCGCGFGRRAQNPSAVNLDVPVMLSTRVEIT